MKKYLFMALTTIFSFSIIGCSTSKVEKVPVIIENTAVSPTAQPTEEVVSGNYGDASSTSENSSTDESNVIADTSDTTDNVINVQTTDTAASDASDEVFTSTIEVEGMEETINCKTYQSSLGYRMDYDIDRFTVTSANGVDSFMAKNPDPEIYPYIFLTINRNDLTSDILENPEYFGQNGILTNEGSNTIKIGKYDAHACYVDSTGDDKWNSITKNVYLIDTDKYVYVLVTQCYSEAVEGYGARLKAMFETFTLE